MIHGKVLLWNQKDVKRNLLWCHQTTSCCLPLRFVEDDLVLLAVVICGRCKLTPNHDPTPVGVTWVLLVRKYANESNITFQAILEFDLKWFWPWYITFDRISKWGFPYCISDQHQLKSIKACGRSNQMLICLSITTNNSGQSNTFLSVPGSFLLRLATQKLVYH